MAQRQRQQLPYFDSLQFADSVESVRKLDNQTVEFHLSGRTPRSSGIWPPTMRQLPLPQYAARLTQDDRQEQLDRQPVGTGPFQLSDYRSGQYVRLQRHPGYWRGKPLMPRWWSTLAPAAPAACRNCADRRMRRAGLASRQPVDDPA
ncbi:ABC transporter substrate-binding protein [Klebsiella pneumoniae subsp. pneumoniae]|nr:ABC transporter substrate-binding protein [Klebsiella pneumoniae subsp. pneumoniae]